MTKRKHLKQLVRARSAKTGESYTAALRHLRPETLEAKMPDVPEALDGRLERLEIKVRDRDRGAAFFHELFGLEVIVSADERGPTTELIGRPAMVDTAIAAVLVDDEKAPAVLPVFRVATDLPTAVARWEGLGGSSTRSSASRAEVTDDQGLRVALIAGEPSPQPESSDEVTGALGVVVLGVPMADKAQAFYRGMFGWEYEVLGGPGRSWTNASPPIGVFQSVAPAIHHWFRVTDLVATTARVHGLGGEAFARDPMGPYQISDCTDDQGTPFSLWWEPPPSSAG